MQALRQKIPQFRPVFDEEDSKAVAEAVRSDWVSEGHLTEELEGKVADRMGVRHAVMVPNGTLAVAAALMAVGVGPGDRVIVPSFTFIATANAVRLCGAEPLFVDISDENFCIHWGIVRMYRKEAKAVVVVAMNARDPGVPKGLKMPVVVDAAAALGTRPYLGSVATLSFAPSKIITTGQGGAVLTESNRIAEEVRFLKDQGRKNKLDYFPRRGFNFKFDDIRAALGLSQMKKLDERLKHMREVCAIYQEELPDACKGEYLWYQDMIAWDRPKLVNSLYREGIETRPFYRTLTDHPPYMKHEGIFTQSKFASKYGLWLPSSADLKPEEVQAVCKVIKS